MSLFAASIAGKSFVSAPAQPMSGVRTPIFTCEVLTLAASHQTTNQVAVAPALVVSPFSKQKSFEIAKNSGVELDGREFLTVPLHRIDQNDKARKRGHNLRVDRLPCDEKLLLQLGSFISLSAYNMVNLLPLRLVKISVIEVDIDEYNGAACLKLVLDPKIEVLRMWTQFSPEALDWTLVAMQAASMVNGPWVHPVYHPKIAAMAKTMQSNAFKDWRTKGEGKKLKKDALYTPKTCAMLTSPMLVGSMPDFSAEECKLADALAMRARMMVWWKDPCMPLVGQNWPHPKAPDAAANVKDVTWATFAYEGLQIVPKPGMKVQLPIKPGEASNVMTANKLMINVLAGDSALCGFGVTDPRHLNGLELHSLIAATPALFRTFMSGGSNVLMEDPGTTDAPIQLSLSVSGAKSSQTVLSDEYGALTDPMVAVVNAGYPVDKTSAVSLMREMAARDPNRYATDMGTLEQLHSPNGELLPANRLLAGSTEKPIINLFESKKNISDMSSTEWDFYLVPNAGVKKCSLGENGKMIETLGMEYFRSLVTAETKKAMENGKDEEDAKEIGMDEAKKAIGEIFVKAMGDSARHLPERPYQAFVQPCGPGAFRFLLFAIQKRYAKARQLDPLCSNNHVHIINRLVKEIYPDDLSDMKDAKLPVVWNYTHAYLKSAPKDDLVGAAADNDDGTSNPPLGAGGKKRDEAPSDLPSGKKQATEVDILKAAGSATSLLSSFASAAPSSEISDDDMAGMFTVDSQMP